MTSIPEQYVQLFQRKGFAYLATLMPDGSPQVTPVWFDFDGTHIRVNSATGRQKDRNMRKRPRVAVAIQDPDNAYRYAQVQGTVVEITEEGANAHIDALAKKYTGAEKYGNHRLGERRVTYTIRIDRLSGLQ